MPSPSIGRVVWYYPSRQHREEGKKPWACFITNYHSESVINVAGFSSGGSHFAANEIPLLSSSAPPADGPHATWMPYQEAQAPAPAPAQPI